jgi:hypothetical protein
MKNHDHGAEKKDRYGAQVAVDPDRSGPEWMKNRPRMDEKSR